MSFVNKYKLYSEIRRNSSERIASDIRREEKKANYRNFDRQNPEIFENGMSWFRDGYKLEDAPENMQINTNFVNGYNKAKRLRDIEIYLYDLGVGYFNEGLSIDDIPEKYRDNPTVLSAYEEASKINKSR